MRADVDKPSIMCFFSLQYVYRFLKRQLRGGEAEQHFRLTHGAAGIGVQDPYMRKTQHLEWLHTKEQKQTEKGPQRD